MSENVQTFSGKVNVADNLLVGTSHFFVDRQNNRVGIGTSTPDASSMLDVTGNIKSGGTITATGGFSGDGSGLSGVNSDSGSWVKDDTNGLIYVANLAHKVGIGKDNPGYTLDVNGDINIPTGSTLRVGGTPAVFSNWTVHTNASDIYRSSGNVGIGVTEPDVKLHVGGGNIRVDGTGERIIENRNDLSDFGTLTLTSGYRGASQRPKIQIHGYKGQGTVNGDNMITFNTNGSERMKINQSGNVGIGADPGKMLDVNGVTRSRQTAGWKSGVFNSTGVNMGPMADGTTDGPQLGWEYHVTFSAASANSRVVIYGAYKHSGALYAASEKWTFRFREGYGSTDYSNYAELVNNSETNHSSYYAVIRVVNPLYTNADVGNARHHFMSHCVGTYSGIGATIWQAQGYIDMGGQSTGDRFNYLRLTSSIGNIKGEWTAFPITT